MRCLTAFLLACPAVLSAAAPPAQAPAEWLKWIDQLGEDETHADAEKKLSELGEEALPTLRRAAKGHSDADVRLRAGLIASALEKKLFGEVRRYQASGWVCRCAVTPDGKKVVCTSDYVRVYDLE